MQQIGAMLCQLIGDVLGHFLFPVPLLLAWDVIVCKCFGCLLTLVALSQ